MVLDTRAGRQVVQTNAVISEEVLFPWMKTLIMGKKYSHIKLAKIHKIYQ